MEISMNNPPVENETSSTAGSSETGGHPSATAPGSAAQPHTGTAGRSTREALAGPFGLRDIVVGASALVMLVGSVLPFITVFNLGIVRNLNLWNGFSLFFVGIGILLPLLVAGLFAARRLAPGTKLRVGSLSLDQFASVSAVLALAFFFIQTVTDFAVGPMIALIGSLGMVVATTLAPHLPFFAAEFKERPEVPAVPAARETLPLRQRPARPKTESANASSPAPRRFENPLRRHSGAGTDGPVTERGTGASAGTAAAASAAGTAVVGTAGATKAQGSQPQPAQPGNVTAPAAEQPAAAPATQAQDVQAPAAPSGGSSEPLAATTVNPVVSSSEPAAPAAGESDAEPITATRDESESVVEAFWFAVGTPRQIVDERTGLPLFMFHPGDWELGLEDRGDEFLVQDKRTGRIGVLRDLSNIERVDTDQ